MRQFCLIMLFVLLAGCGSKGKLYLPEPTKDESPKKESTQK